MDNPFFTCPTCGAPVARATKGRSRVYCSPACRPSLYRPKTPRAEMHAAFEARASNFRQRRAAGESLISIAASEGISRQRVHAIINGQKAATKKTR